MFEDFANVWTPVEPSRSVGRKPVATKVAGEPVVLFRDAHGAVGALIDRCPHRGVALSLGAVGEDGCLECPFHGWRFDTQGVCTKIPLNDLSDEKRVRHAATPLATREAGGVIWVYTGDAARAPEPEIPPRLVQPGTHYWPSAETWATHWTRAMENMLDYPHLPYAHRATIGRFTRYTPEAVMKTEVATETFGMTIRARVDGAEQSAWLEWRRPNCTVLNIEMPGRAMQLHIFCVPVDPTHTRMILVRARPDGLIAPIANRLSALFSRKVLFEDRRITESSHPIEVPEPGLETSVATDAPTLAFRKYYLRELKGTGGGGEGLVPAARLVGNGRSAA